MSNIRYNNELLQNLCNQNNISLTCDYSKQKLNRDTYIKGKCLTEDCLNEFKRTFRYLYNNDNNFYCEECTKNIAKVKAKNTFINKYGVENPMLLKETKNKIKKTLMEKFNVEHQMYLKETKEKMKNTIQKKYGEKHFSMCNEIKEKIKKTCLENYGVECFFQSKEFKEKSKATCMLKYNLEFPAQSKEFKEKAKQTNLANYGVENPLQRDDIMEKVIKNSYKFKSFALPSGNIIKCQGYEPFALNDLINKYQINENDIVVGIKNVPKIWYLDDNNKKHRHYVDIFITSQNKCIEVKSHWTFNKTKHISLKQTASKQLGYLYEIWIYNKKGERIECII